jgi:acyl-CoA thioester hydrolase
VPVSRHRYRCPLRWGDLDAQGHVNNAAFLDYLQEARVDWLLAGPPEMGHLLDAGVLVVGHQVEYLVPVGYSDRPLTIELWVDAVGASRFGIAYDVRDGDVLVARARTAATPFDLAGGALRRLTPVEREVLTGAREPVEPLRPLPRAAVREPAHHYPLAVRWSDLDSYGHVNNVKYFDYLQEARIVVMHAALDWQPEDVWVVARQDVEYRRPIDFRPSPYDVATSVAAVGTRSFTLAVEIRDPDDRALYATGRTVVVGTEPLTTEQRAALSRWAPELCTATNQAAPAATGASPLV